MDKKNVVIWVLSLLLVAVIAGGAVYIWQQEEAEEETASEVEQTDDVQDTTGDDQQDDTTTTPEDSEDAQPEEDDEELITQALATKLGSDPEDLLMSFDENDGNHANGTVGFVGEIGGGWWLAAKDDGVWVIVADGNGVVMCDLIAPYDFPTSMVPECWDGTQNVIR